MSRFTNQTVVVTGAAGGIGSVLCDRFAQEGAHLVLADLNDEGLTEVAAQLEGRHGVKVVSAVGDLSTRQGAERVTELATSTFGRLDVLVNNAGVGPISPLDDLRVEEWEAMVDVNFKGVLYGIAAALPVFRKQGTGQFVTTVSTAGLRIVPGQAVYAATKNAVRTLCEGCGRRRVRTSA
jgi:NADP-dependent 3-hydroxy acid dehydrogenase YdfG